MIAGRLYLFAIMVEMDTEGRIFLLEPIQSTRKIGCFDTLRFDGKGDDGLGHKHGCLARIDQKPGNTGKEK